MDDDRLADLLEELPESEQVQVIEGLDLDNTIKKTAWPFAVGIGVVLSG